LFFKDIKIRRSEFVAQRLNFVLNQVKPPFASRADSILTCSWKEASFEKMSPKTKLKKSVLLKNKWIGHQNITFPTISISLQHSHTKMKGIENLSLWQKLNSFQKLYYKYPYKTKSLQHSIISRFIKLYFINSFDVFEVFG